MLELPDVTLTIIETMEHELGRMAVNDCVTKAKFGGVVIFTDKPELFFPIESDVTFVRVPNWPTKLEWSKFSWYGVHEHVRTAQTLHVQWDSWIWQPEMWRDEFLEYDIVGAPWWYTDGKNVGNLGFSLRSTRLIRYVHKYRTVFPCTTNVDDDLLCRTYRPKLEEIGFVWAPERVAHDFAFECCRPSPTSKHFGFHAAMNFNKVLSEGQLFARARMMARSPYISKPGSYLWKQFAENNPEIVAEL